MKSFLRILIIVLLGGLGGLLTYDAFFTARVVRDVRLLRQEGEGVQAAYRSNDISIMLNTIETLAPEIAQLNNDLQYLRLLPRLPILGTQISAMRTLSAAAATTIDDMLPLAFQVQRILQLVPTIERIEDVPPEARRQLLRMAIESAPLLTTFTTHSEQTLTTLKALQPEALLNPLGDYVAQAQELLTAVIPGAKKLQSFVDIVPYMAGYRTSQSYLLLLMNNFELRPGGGFIGTYGVLKVTDGEVQDLTTDDIYNLDRPSHARLSVTPPPPMSKYLLTPSFNKWLLRDSNWSPDFAINAQRALSFYRLEQGAHAENINGVIALTPTLIAKLLELTGPISVEGETFTASTIFDVLEWHVEKGYIGKRIPKTQRKEIIGPFAHALKTALLRLPIGEWQRVLDVLMESAQERALMAWTLDPSINRTLATHNVAGPVVDTPKPGEDVLIVLDANMRALKTDQVMQKSITYTVTQNTDTSLTAEVRSTYKNTGTYSWKWGTYRSYTRILVPEGSVLKGNDQGIETASELGHTTFGTFFTVDPGQEKTISFRYILAAAVAEQVKAGIYTLKLIKQAGTPAIPLTFSINSAKITKQIQTDLKTDRTISL